jgi:hypothetical protein
MAGLKAFPDELKVMFVHRWGHVMTELGWLPRMTRIHLGAVAGTLVQHGFSPQHAIEITDRVVDAWRNNAPLPPELAACRPIGDDEVIKLHDGASRIPASDEAGQFDLGVQFGQRVESGMGMNQAYRECGAWLVGYWPEGGDNPWGPVAGTHPDPLVGELRYSADRKSFADDTGPRNLCGVHLGDIFGQAIRFGVGHVIPYLDLASAAGYHYFRGWINVPPHPWWADKPVPHWDIRENSSAVRQVVTAAMERGMKVHFASGGLAGMNDPNEDEMFHELGDLIDDIGPECVALVEACNEVFGTGDSDDKEPGELEQLVNLIRMRFPNLLYSLSAAAGADEERDVITRFTPRWAHHYYYHTLREGRLHDKIRHAFGMGYSGEHPAVRRLGWSGEPWGNGRMVSVTGNKHELTATGAPLGAAMGWVARQAWTVMGGSSVILGDDPIDSPGFYETPELCRKLPRDLATFDVLNHSGRTNSPRIWVARGDCRSDYAIHNDGRFVAINYGPPEQNPHMMGQERHVREAEVVHTTDFGRVIVGRL